eukprot:13669039-Alexandrium_andersonii.AAC.1
MPRGQNIVRIPLLCALGACPPLDPLRKPPPARRMGGTLRVRSAPGRAQETAPNGSDSEPFGVLGELLRVFIGSSRFQRVPAVSSRVE